MGTIWNGHVPSRGLLVCVWSVLLFQSIRGTFVFCSGGIYSLLARSAALSMPPKEA